MPGALRCLLPYRGPDLTDLWDRSFARPPRVSGPRPYSCAAVSAISPRARAGTDPRSCQSVRGPREVGQGSEPYYEKCGVKAGAFCISRIGALNPNIQSAVRFQVRAPRSPGAGPSAAPYPGLIQLLFVGCLCSLPCLTALTAL